MQRHSIVFNNIPYIIEYRRSTEMLVKHAERFVMLRKYDIVNDIAIDEEIYIANLNDYKEAIKYNSEDKSFYQTNALCYPVNNDKNIYFSSDIMQLMSSSRYQSLYFNENKDKDYYILRDNKGEPLYINCDEIRIYKPHNRQHIPFIIDVSNIVNDIHFHYFCQLMENQKINISKEINYENNKYYEYISFYIPSLDFLFNDKLTFYNEDLNIFVSPTNEDGYYEDNQMPLSNLILPYRIEKNCNKKISCENCDLVNTCDKIDIKNINVKSLEILDIHSNEYINSDYNFKNIPLVISLHHYDTLDDNVNLYMSSTGILETSAEIVTDNKFYLSSRIDFDYNNQSILSVVSEFIYPKLYNNDGTFMSLKEAYFQLNKINEQEYEKFEGHDDDIFLDNFSEEFIESLKFNKAGYVIELSKSRDFSGVFYRQACATKYIDDFTFNLNGIFEDWKEYPEIIFVRTMFIDKFLSKIFYGPIQILNKEKFKYCINESVNTFRLDDIVKYQTPVKINSLEDMNVNDIFFIDKVNCSIKKHDITKENVVVGNTNSAPTIVYKTVFYKTQDLQNIRIRSTVTQKIGINLANYLSKVENFKLKLDGYEFTETERNDIYVIFTIPGSQISAMAGVYDIVNEKDEYIDSGNFTLY